MFDVFNGHVFFVQLCRFMVPVLRELSKILQMESYIPVEEVNVDSLQPHEDYGSRFQSMRYLLEWDMRRCLFANSE